LAAWRKKTSTMSTHCFLFNSAGSNLKTGDAQPRLFALNGTLFSLHPFQRSEPALRGTAADGNGDVPTAGTVHLLDASVFFWSH